MEHRIESHSEVIKSLLEWKEAIEKTNELQAEMIQMGEKVIKAFSALIWLGNGIKWLCGLAIAVFAAFTTWKGFIQ